MIIHLNFRFILGIMLLFILIGMNVFAFFFSDSIIKNGTPARPPSLYLFQKVLYHQPIEEETVEDFFSFTVPEEIDQDAEELIFSRNPKRTATVGREYRYVPSSQRLRSKASFWVEEGPSGMKYEDGAFIWTPDTTQIGKYDISLATQMIDSETIRSIRFKLFSDKKPFYFGTNERGNSVLGLMIAGSKWSILPGFIAVLIAVFGGLFLGAYSGYNKNLSSNIVDGATLVLESIPALLLFFLAAVIFSFNIYIVMIAVGLVLLPANINVIKSTVKHFVDCQFVESSKEIGFADNQILYRDIIWYNCKPIIISQIANCFAFAIMVEVTLSYLQFGIQVPEVSWGNILLQGKSDIYKGEYWMVFFPSLVIIMSLLSFYLTGNGLSRLLDPRKNST